MFTQSQVSSRRVLLGVGALQEFAAGCARRWAPCILFAQLDTLPVSLPSKFLTPTQSGQPHSRISQLEQTEVPTLQNRFLERIRKLSGRR